MERLSSNGNGLADSGFHTQRDGASFIVVTTSAEAAESLIQDSPLKRTLIVEDPTTSGADAREPTWASTRGPRSTVTSIVNPLPADVPTTPTTDKSNDLGLSHATFAIYCFDTNRRFKHMSGIRSNPLHGPWPINERGAGNIGRSENFISAALRRSVPAGQMAPALRDWVTGGQLARYSDVVADEQNDGALSILLGKTRAQTYNWQQGRARLRQRGKGVPEVMRSLSGFADKYKQGGPGRPLPPNGVPFRWRA